ncbi:MAG: hypothetical protein KC621_00200 [Myxococcales bacterium]|nr:hypothetical protein [Myxococcales bacterium]MCB9685381.1 hypothetical protein [Alphaproteobacteria bacterium]
MRRLWPLLMLAPTACEPVQPCDDYVDYMCACHGEDADCNELSLTYASADPDVQDECAVLLDQQQEQDDDAGLTCTQ